MLQSQEFIGLVSYINKFRDDEGDKGFFVRFGLEMLGF
jgi:hypothetical protein